MADLPRHARRHSRRSMAQINVVPFIDVMLVLLIIFMITAPMLQQGVEVDLPQAQAEVLDPAQQAREPLVLTVSAAGAMSLNTGPLVHQPLSMAEILDVVRARLLQDPSTQTYVRGDRTVEYGRVMDAMVALQQAGAARVGLLTEPPPVGAVTGD
jgi:biopolymer transport protein TolR